MAFIGICQINHFMHEKIIQIFTSNRIVENRWTVFDKTDKIRCSTRTPDRQQSKTLLTIDERGQKLLETVSGSKLQSKTLFLTMYHLRSSIVLSFSIATHG